MFPNNAPFDTVDEIDVRQIVLAFHLVAQIM
jgi:hypothetical protein